MKFALPRGSRKTALLSELREMVIRQEPAGNTSAIPNAARRDS